MTMPAPDRPATRPHKMVRRVLLSLAALLAITAFVLFVGSPDGEAGDFEKVEASLTTDALDPAPPAASPPATTLPESAPPDVDGEGSTGLYRPNGVARLEDLGAEQASAPVRLEIDAIDVDAPIDPYGVNPRSGQMDVPRNVRDVAWYRYGPSPGQRGSAVLAAHVDLAGQGPGVFYRLRELELGDQISVTYEDGSRQLFEIEARVTYQKDELPLDAVFSRDGQAVLTLITCGGGFSESAQRYDSNVVVYAVPVTRDLTETQQSA